MIKNYKDYISSNNIIINNDENIIEDVDLLDIYNTENYLNNDILNSDYDSDESEDKDEVIVIESQILKKHDSSDDDVRHKDKNNKSNINNLNYSNKINSQNT